jgi:hypothetical protein
VQIEAYTFNMHGYIERLLEHRVTRYFQVFPAVAILGPRQCGKSTLARRVAETRGNSVYLDLETSADRNKLQDPGLFFEHHQGKLVCLDEIQLMPEIFKELRTILDRDGGRTQILILGSASRDLIRQSSESLAGRIGYLELTPFLLSEISQKSDALKRLWLRGAFPRSFLADDDELSRIWRDAFIRTYLERDIPQLGFHIPAATLGRLWSMCAHEHGGLLNSSKLGASLGISHTTVRKYLDLLSQTFMLRLLKPMHSNLKKRLVKSPKVYIRDTGILNQLLGIDGFGDLMGHPVFGSSWEGFCIENILATCPDWNPSFYRTAKGAELDLVLEYGQRRIAIEFKASSAPKLSRGFWTAIEDIEPEKTWVTALVDEAYPIAPNVLVTPLPQLLTELREL